ncbi:unnamed protein product [Discosporangium mesarthrocarpum]
MERVEGFVQKYAWGRRGSFSKVAQLKAAGDEEYTIKEDETYAEMWIGTHPCGPCRVVRNGISGVLLKDHIDNDPSSLGAIKHKGDLPFLFKVISIDKALSIQAHPNKLLAERLHAERPEIYKDDNHKPEMAVTLSDFEALCGFRPLQEIIWNMHHYPELRAMLSLDAIKAVQLAGNDVARQKRALKMLFGSYMRVDPEVAKAQVARVVARLSNPLPQTKKAWEELKAEPARDGEVVVINDVDAKTKLCAFMYERGFRGGNKAMEAMDSRLERNNPDIVRVMLRLSQEYPGDLGIFMPLVLNFLKLKTGQAFFMTVDEPHAYLQGDILECMACSNNVVRAALTPKYRDIELLVEMLSYNMGAPAVLPVEPVDHFRKRYTPPISEFEIEDVRVPENEAYHIESMPVPAVLVTLAGGEGGIVIEEKSGREIEASEGGVFFLPADTNVTLVADKHSPMHLAMAHTNLNWGSMQMTLSPRGYSAPNF